MVVKTFCMFHSHYMSNLFSYNFKTNGQTATFSVTLFSLDRITATISFFLVLACLHRRSQREGFGRAQGCVRGYGGREKRIRETRSKIEIELKVYRYCFIFTFQQQISFLSRHGQIQKLFHKSVNLLHSCHCK